MTASVWRWLEGGGAGQAAGGRRRRVAALAMLATMLAAQSLNGASITRNATMTATVNALAKLTLSRATLSFPDADPDTVPNITASGGPLAITAKARTAIGSTVTLSVQASGNLQSGLDAIPISQVSWTAAGPGFVGGTLSSTTAQPVGTWISSGSWSGTQTYSLANSWSYVPGTYSATLTYTLTAP
jgi:hypothetical protein